MTISDARKKKECPGKNNCQKILMLYDHEWASELQLGQVIVKTCWDCPLKPLGAK